MARYWQSSTFNGFFVEGNRQDQTLTELLSEALEGIKTKEIIGAGFYIWLDKGDPKIRVKDLADRTLVELLVPEAPSSLSRKRRNRRSRTNPSSKARRVSKRVSKRSSYPSLNQCLKRKNFHRFPGSSKSSGHRSMRYWGADSSAQT